MFSHTKSRDDPLPTKIIYNITDKFQQTDLTGYTDEGKPAFSYEYEYDRASRILTIYLTFNENIWGFKSSSGNIIKPDDVIGKQIIFSLAYFDKTYPNGAISEKISDYLSSSREEKLL